MVTYSVFICLCFYSGWTHSSFLKLTKLQRTRLQMTTTAIGAVADNLGSDSNKKFIALKSYGTSSEKLNRDIFNVAVPALASCLVEPLLTIVDSIFVAKGSCVASAATSSLAAMSINVAIFNLLEALTCSLCTSTTALVSKAFGSDQDASKTSSKLQRIFINGLFLSFSIGSMISLLLQYQGSQMISCVFGPDTVVLLEAVSYLKIRALSLPFVLSRYVVVGYSLGTQQLLAPLLSISIAFVANVLGDALLVGRWGLAGAAAATSISSVLGCTVAMCTIFAQQSIALAKTSDKVINNFRFLANASAQAGGKTVRFYLRHINQWLLNAVSIFDLHTIRAFFSTSTVLLAGLLLDNLTYSCGAKVSSIFNSADFPMIGVAVAGAADSMLSPSTVEVAAHQITLQLWWFLSFFSTPLSLVAQSILPRDRAAGNISRVKLLLQKLFKLVGLVAVGCTIVNTAVPVFFPSIFTSSSIVQACVCKVTLQAGLSMALISVVQTLDGIFIGSDRLRDYMQASLLSMGAAWTYYAYSMQVGLGLVGAWNGLLLFSVVRVVFYATRFPSLWQGITGGDSLRPIAALPVAASAGGPMQVDSRDYPMSSVRKSIPSTA